MDEGRGLAATANRPLSHGNGGDSNNNNNDSEMLRILNMNVCPSSVIRLPPLAASSFFSFYAMQPSPIYGHAHSHEPIHIFANIDIC